MASLVTLTYSQPSRSLAPGEVLITEGSPGGTLYVLEDGRLSVERGGVVIATISEPGALIGEMSVLLGTHNTATVRAEKASGVRVVKDAIRYLERQPEVALRVATVLAARLDKTSKVLVDLQSEHKDKPEQHGLLSRLASSLFYQGSQESEPG
ncbi:MAG: cyclic nucleotide-binding domain-containing protein [Devosia sp.]